MTVSDLLSLFKTAGTVRTRLGTPIDVSSNGTTTVPTQALDNLIRDRFQDMRDPAVRSRTGAGQTHS